MCVKRWQVARLEKFKTPGQRNHCSTSNVELHLYVPLAPGPKSNQVWNMPRLATPNVYI